MSSLKKELRRSIYFKKDVCRKAFVKITAKGRLVNVLLERNRDMKLTAEQCAAMKMSAT